MVITAADVVPRALVMNARPRRVIADTAMRSAGVRKGNHGEYQQPAEDSIGRLEHR